MARFGQGHQVLVDVRGSCAHCAGRGYFEVHEVGGPTHRRDCDACIGRGVVDKTLTGTIARRWREGEGNVQYEVVVPCGPGNAHTGARAMVEVPAKRLRRRARR